MKVRSHPLAFVGRPNPLPPFGHPAPRPGPHLRCVRSGPCAAVPRKQWAFAPVGEGNVLGHHAGMNRSVRIVAACLALALASVAASTSSQAQAPSSLAQPADPFPNRHDVRVDELLAAVATQLEAVARSPDVGRDYASFLR